MLTVSIFEDIASHAKQLNNAVSQWADETKQEVRFVCCCDGRELTSSIIAQSDILFLDIELPGADGIALARTIREQNEEIPIVFVTNHTQYVFKGYTVQAFRYLLKPVAPDECAACMQRALRYHESKGSRFLTISFRNGTEQLPIRSVLYIEADDHYINIFTTNGVRRYHKRLSELAEQLEGTPLLRCHRSYIVNGSHIYTVEDAHAVLDDRSCVPISRAAMPAILSYLSQNIGGGGI